MYNQLFPTKIDNSFQGHKLALWLFGLVLLVKAAQSVSVLMDGYEIVRSADGIPLETYTSGGAHAVVAAFGGMAVSRLTMTLICAIALFKYRSALVLLFALLATHDVVRELVLHPVREGTPIGIFVNLVLFVFILLGLGLSVRHPIALNGERRTND
jgi:hypothetical protein